MHVIILRNGKQLEEPKGNSETNESGKESEEPQSEKVGTWGRK